MGSSRWTVHIQLQLVRFLNWQEREWRICRYHSLLIEPSVASDVRETGQMVCGDPTVAHHCLTFQKRFAAWWDFTFKMSGKVFFCVRQLPFLSHNYAFRHEKNAASYLFKNNNIKMQIQIMIESHILKQHEPCTASGTKTQRLQIIMISLPETKS